MDVGILSDEDSDSLGSGNRDPDWDDEIRGNNNWVHIGIPNRVGENLSPHIQTLDRGREQEDPHEKHPNQK